MSDRRPPTFPRKCALRNFLPEHRRALLCHERYTPLGRLTRRREKPAAVPDFVPRCEKCRPLYQISYRASRNAALCTHMKKFTGTAGSFSRQENRPRGTPGWIARHLSPRNGTLDDFSRHPFLSAGTEGDISCSSRDPTGTEGNISRHGFRRGGTEDGISRRGPRRAVQRTAFLGAGTGGTVHSTSSLGTGPAGRYSPRYFSALPLVNGTESRFSRRVFQNLVRETPFLARNATWRRVQ